MEKPSPGQSPVHVPVTLIDLLSNALVRRHTSPYIPVADLLQLGATCKLIRQLIYQDTEAWRHLDLTPVRRAIIDSTPIDVGGVSWRAERMDERSDRGRLLCWSITRQSWATCIPDAY